MKKNLILFTSLILLLTSCSIFDPNSNKEKLKGKRIDVIGYEDDEKISKSTLIDNYCGSVNGNGGLQQKSIKVDVFQSFGLDSDIIIVDDRLINLNSYGELVAYSLDLKQKIWSYKIKNINKMVFIGGLSHDQEKIYASYGGDKIIAIGLKDGKEKWSVGVDDIVKSSPLVHKDKIFVQTTNNHLYAINRNDGKILWRHVENAVDFKSSNMLQPLVIENNVYMQVDGREVTVLNLETGKITDNISLIERHGFRSFNNKRSFVNFLAADGDVIYTIASNGELVAIDTNNNLVMWKSKIFLQSPFLIDDDNIYIISENNQLIVLNKRNGKIRWMSDLASCMTKKREGLWVSPVIYQNQILLVHYSGLMVAFEKDSGKALWKRDDVQLMTHKPLILGDKIYMSSNDGRIYSYYK